ncbi:hypothetical protein PIB30_073836 [Stylosanthes scabra]|uniref:Uncharacterized protein n=1 Tax=Stylosanthes scabra TaxID=79078 RepID=A0ABU6TRK3_9FABA|nr:hypothetical protein [Stylosanthes scabra]
MDESENSYEDEEEDASDLGTDKKGMSLDMYFKVHGISLDDEENEEDEEDEKDERAKDNWIMLSNCKKLHNSEFKDRQEVEFYQGQPIGPTRKVISDLRNFLGTVVRNPTFVTLLYTSRHGVSDKSKEDMWEYINEKFILPIESMQWVMQALCRAWKKYKGQIKLLHFMKYKTKEQMMRNRPLHIPEVQFRKLIRYWRLPEIKALSEKNIENRSKQTCPHRMGSTGFAFVRKQLRDSKENNEEPSRAEIFTVTRSSKKGKEIDPKSQSTIDELKRRIEAGEDHEDAFVQVLEKDPPGRLRSYGASITKKLS